jgi:hypothetical protein
VEAELANRVGELVVEVEAWAVKCEAQREEVELAKSRLQHAEQAMLTFKDRIETDYVSRQQMSELEALYSESMSRLAARVESLEGVRRAGSSPAVSAVGGPSGLTGTSMDRSGARHSAGLPAVGPVGPNTAKRGGLAGGGVAPRASSVSVAPMPLSGPVRQPPHMLPADRAGRGRGGLPAIASSVGGASGPPRSVAWALPVPAPAPAPVREEDLGMDLNDARSLLSSILSGNRAV